MRTVYLVRHGLSQANNRESAAFGANDAELMPAGIEHAKVAGQLLIGRYALLQVNQVATSTMRRAQQTAEVAGFASFTAYPELDEVPVLIDGHATERRERWHKGEFEPHILDHARNTLQYAPSEQIWFTRGLVIAGICKELGQYKDTHPIPRFGEVREIALDT